MRALPLSPHRISNLSFAGLIALDLVLVGSLAVALFAAFKSSIPAAIWDVCLKMMASSWDLLVFHFSSHPLAALAVAFITGSLLWATMRAGASLARSWRLFSRVALYNAGESKKLDRVLTADPSLQREAGIASSLPRNPWSSQRAFSSLRSLCRKASSRPSRRRSFGPSCFTSSDMPNGGIPSAS